MIASFILNSLPSLKGQCTQDGSHLYLKVLWIYFIMSKSTDSTEMNVIAANT